MKSTQTNVVAARVIAGLGFMAMGVLAFLGSLEVIDFGWLWSNFWPVAVILIGALIWLANPKNWLWSSIIVLAGIASLVAIHADFNFNVWSLFWPIVMVGIGVSIISRIGKSSRSDVGDINSDYSDQFALMSGSEHRVVSKSYAGGKATAIMGGVELDLRETSIKGKAVLDVFVLMGGIEVKVPAGVNVVSDAGVILGGVEIKPDTKVGKNDPVLVITGNVALGGVEVKY